MNQMAGLLLFWCLIIFFVLSVAYTLEALWDWLRR